MDQPPAPPSLARLRQGQVALVRRRDRAEVILAAWTPAGPVEVGYWSRRLDRLRRLGPLEQRRLAAELEAAGPERLVAVGPAWQRVLAEHADPARLPDLVERGEVTLSGGLHGDSWWLGRTGAGVLLVRTTPTAQTREPLDRAGIGRVVADLPTATVGFQYRHTLRHWFRDRLPRLAAAA